jgi:murein DD-endopeptidase MepM/ murein hydrolase activator NlpD
MLRRLVSPRASTVRPGLRRRVWLTVPAAALVVLVAVLPAGAQGSDDRRQQLQQQIGEASAQEAQALAQLQDIRNRKFTIDMRVLELENQLQAAQAKLVPLEAEATRAADALAGAEAELVRTQHKLERAQHKLDNSAAEMYTSARSGTTYERILTAPPDETIRGDRYLDHLSRQRDRTLRQVTRLRDEVQAQKDARAHEKAAADAAEAQAQAERDNVARLRTEIEPARTEAANQEAAEAAALADIQAKKAQYEAEYNALQAASDAIAAMLRSRGSGSGVAGGCEARPVPGDIGSGFGMRYHPVLHYSRMHTGVDMHASQGEPIHACRAGTVVQVGWNGGYGNTVIIDHGGGMATLYGHQSQTNANVGQQVAAGDVIGYVGSTGMSTGPHLHFEVRLGGNPVDPAAYL